MTRAPEIPTVVIETLARVERLLTDVYTAEGREIWWYAANRNFGGKPPGELLGYVEGRARLIREAERLAAA